MLTVGMLICSEKKKVNVKGFQFFPCIGTAVFLMTIGQNVSLKVPRLANKDCTLLLLFWF